MSITHIGDVDHIFICEGWHVFNDMYPFYKSLQIKNKYFFTNVARKEYPDLIRIRDLNTFRSNNKRAVIYISFPRHYVKFVKEGPLSRLSSYRVVRMFHGIVGPWANVVRNQPEYLDVIIAASNLDAAIWRQYSNYRVETIGWPKGDAFIRDQIVSEAEAKSKIIIASNWAEEKADFRICDHLHALSDYEITFMLHPLIKSNRYSRRRIDPSLVKQQLKKLASKRISVVDCREGVLPHMNGKDLMLGVISSSSYEWLLFDKPIIFLRGHPVLNFGPVLDYTSNIHEQIQNQLGVDSYSAKRKNLRSMLMSHLDGMWSERFNQLALTLEQEVLR